MASVAHIGAPSIAGYLLKERIGRGGAGTVYRAARPGEPDVALKTVQAGTPVAVASLRNEIRILRRVRHPCVVRIVDDGVEAGVPWLAMELVPGESLEAVLHRDAGAGRPPFQLRLTILRRVAQTLAYLHGRGLVHRDLSPRNVIVRDARPVLIDFGFASIANEEGRRRIDEATAGLGTVPYLAPEQIVREELDARTDLYAFGCLLYEALVGRPPFVGSPQEIVRGHLTGQPVPPSRLVPELPPELDAVVASLLAKDRRARTAYALDVADKLAMLGAEGLADATEVEPQPYLYGCSLVGRADIVAEIEPRLAEAAVGPGCFLSIVGESGVGKTRLLAEAMRIARPLGMAIVSGRGVSVEAEPHRGADPAAGPLHPLRSVLQLAADRCRDGGSAEVALLFGTEQPLLADHDPTLRQVIGPASSERTPLSPEGAREEILAEARHLLRALAAQGPQLLLFDDLQWADELTFALLESLKPDFFAGLPLCIVTAHRADEIDPAMGEKLRRVATRTLEVARLDRDAAERIAREMLGTHDDQSPILHNVLSDAQGNPFFLTEYMRTALAQGWLRRGGRGGWTLQSPGREALRDAQRLPMPDSMRSLFERRLHDLDDQARSVLVAAAVIGTDVPFCCLRGVVPDLAPESLFELLDELCERQLLRSRAEGFAFAHDKIRETTYDLTGEDERRRVHARAAEWLERHRATSETHAHVSDEALAHHFAAGGDPVRALVYLEHAADIAFRSGAHRAAAEMFGRAIELASRVRGEPDARRAAAWRRKRADARFALGDVDGCIEDCRAAFALLGRPLPRSEGGWGVRVATGLTTVLATTLIAALRRSADSRADRLEEARCAGLLASSYYFTLSLTPMLAILLWGLLWARRSGQAALVIEAEARLAYVAGVAGFPRLASGIFAVAGRRATRREHGAARARAQYLEALYLLGRGEWSRVVSAADAAAETLKELGDVQDAEIAQTVAAHAHYFGGDVARAAAGFEAVLASARARTNAQHIGWGLFLTARSSLAMGRVADAVPPLEEARRILTPLADRSSIAICEGLLATAYVRAGDHGAAAAVLGDLMPRLSGGPMPLPPCIDAYQGAAEAAVILWRTDRASRARERDARRAVRGLERFASLFPFAREPSRKWRSELRRPRSV